MKLKPYPSYKTSNLAWLDLIPEHWQSVNLKWVADIFSGGTPSKDKPEYWIDGTIPWINSGAVNQVNITEASEFITEEAYESSSAKWIPKHALVMALAGQGKTKGMVAKLLIDTTCNQSMAAIVPVGNTHSNFLFWWLTSQYQNIRNLSGGDLRDGLNLDLLGSITCPLISKDEQHAITNFLERETEKLDTLIAKQEKLIELLQEKRQAIISHAVTKGLNPDAKMKDSGVEWLGMVPEDWEVKRLGYLTKKIGSGKTPLGGGDAYSSEGVMFIRSQNVYDDGLRLDDVVFISEELDLEMLVSRVLPKDILLNITGASIGRSCIFPDAFAKANVNQHVCIIRMLDDSTSDYIALVMKSYSIKSQINFNQNGAGREGLNFPQIANLVIAMPPMSQQLEILKFINQKTSQIDMLIDKASRSVELAKEHRTALISAAVTGKIDVREAA